MNNRRALIAPSALLLHLCSCASTGRDEPVKFRFPEEGPTPWMFSKQLAAPNEEVTPLTLGAFGDCDAYSPAVIDATQFGFTSNKNGRLDIWVWEVSSGAQVGMAPSELVSTGYDEKNPAFGGKDAKRCFFVTDSNGSAKIFDVSFPKRSGMNLRVDSPGHANWPDVSADGNHLLYSVLDTKGKYVVWHYSFETGNSSIMTEGQRARFNPADPGQFVYTRQGVNGVWNLCLFDVRTRKQSQLTHGPGSAFDPAFSPDGQSIAYASNESGSTDIYVMDVKDLLPKRVVSHGAIDCQPVWSLDGRNILFASNRGGSTFAIYMTPAPEGDEASRPAQ